jgi:hypothetical protein
MRSEELVRLRKAFEIDITNATRPETDRFAHGRIALIDAELQRRKATAASQPGRV